MVSLSFLILEVRSSKNRKSDTPNPISLESSILSPEAAFTLLAACICFIFFEINSISFFNCSFSGILKSGSDNRLSSLLILSVHIVCTNSWASWKTFSFFSASFASLSRSAISSNKSFRSFSWRHKGQLSFLWNLFSIVVPDFKSSATYIFIMPSTSAAIFWNSE